jgi:hypothetical protein
LARYQGVVWQSEQLTLEKVATAALAPEAPSSISALHALGTRFAHGHEFRLGLAASRWAAYDLNRESASLQKGQEGRLRPAQSAGLAGSIEGRGNGRPRSTPGCRLNSGLN